MDDTNMNWPHGIDSLEEFRNHLNSIDESEVAGFGSGSAIRYAGSAKFFLRVWVRPYKKYVKILNFYISAA